MTKCDFAITFKDATEANIRFTIQNFSQMKGPCFSPPCYLLNIPWRIMVMPRAVRDEVMGWSKRHLGYFIHCNVDSKSKWSCYVIADLILHAVRPDVEPYRKTIRHIFDARRNSYGFKFYLPWDDMLDTSKGYIKDDCVTLELHLITEAPKNMGMCYDWGDLEGRVFVPKNKWSDAYKSILENNSMLEKERSFLNTKKERLSQAEELFELLHSNITQFGKVEDTLKEEDEDEIASA